MKNYDVLIVGAGVTGAAIARELSRYQLKVCVLEKEEDVCCGTSKANSAIVHAGYDAPTGSLMAKLNVLGNEWMGPLCKELDIPFRRNGSLVICTASEDIPHLQALYEQGICNGVKGLRIIYQEELRKMEPNITEQAIAALYAPSAGIVDPFWLTIGLAESACTNGVDFVFNSEVTSMNACDKGIIIKTPKQDYQAQLVINAAGVYADSIHHMLSQEPMTIIARRGEYCLLDKAAGGHVQHTIFTLPGNYGKGVLVAPTVHGNLLVGPTAVDVDNKEGTNTSAAGLAELIEKASLSVERLPMRQVITSFAGLRAHELRHEFIIGSPKDTPNLIDCAGIESPGLSSSPAIGKMVAEMVAERLQPSLNSQFQAKRQGILHPQSLSAVERNQLIQQNPAYGQIICRCEMITEGEIVDAIRRPLGARSLDGVKRRTRAGMGRCQAGFCSPRVMEILSRELGTDMSQITKSGGKSRIIAGQDKDSYK